MSIPIPRPTDRAEDPSTASPDDLRLLSALGRTVAASRNVEAALRAALEGIVQALGAKAGAVFLLDEEADDLVCRCAAGSAKLRGLRLGRDDNLLGPCLRGETVGAAKLSGTLGPLWRDAGSDLGPALCAPLTADGPAIGAVMVAHGIGDQGFGARERDLLHAVATTLALAVSNVRRIEELTRRNALERDLHRAAELQRDLLPDAKPGELPVYGLNRPIRIFSGDFFDFFTLPDGRIPFCLGDVSGKGLNAALLMAKSASLFRCLAKGHNDPSAILSIMNHEICDTSSRGMFVTMVAGVYDRSKGELRFANAGHQPPLLRSEDHSYQTFPATAPPLGVAPEIPFPGEVIHLGGGEFYIFSDGLTEFRYGSTEELGVGGLIQLVEGLLHLPLAQRVRALLSELDQEGWMMRDDLTLLAIDDAWVNAHA